MTPAQFAAVVQALEIGVGSKVLILRSDSKHLQKATVTRMAKDGTWFNADVESGTSCGWTNGTRCSAESICNISKL